MGLSRQESPLSTGAIGRLLVLNRCPKRLLYGEPLRPRALRANRTTREIQSRHITPAKQTEKVCRRAAKDLLGS